MLIAARNALMAGKHTPTAKDYMQDGLIAMWDGIENAGWGVHSDSDLVDLVGGHMSFKGVCEENCFISVPVYAVPEGLGNAVGFELCCFIPSVGKYIPFMGPNNMGIMMWDGTVTTINGNNDRGIASKAIVGAHTISVMKDDPRRIHIDSVEPNYINYVAGSFNPYSSMSLGGRKYGSTWNYVCTGMKVFNLRFYSRVLTAEEIAANYAIDKTRFNLPDA